MTRRTGCPPLLVFGWGNPSRGDDALGPLAVERLRRMDAVPGRAEFLDDYQLQVEHALDLQGRERVLFIDASVECDAPFAASPLRPARDASFTTHAMSPAAVMQVYRDLFGAEPPPCTLLAIRASTFELGAPPQPAALAHLEAALAWARHWMMCGAGPAGA
ncbi:MAG TPA: hydrogenase maturation protease [Burkholderiaceae bacterium]|nr:hydrogenase maturation protease [Burkholderiaceae bacterium]